MILCFLARFSLSLLEIDPLTERSFLRWMEDNSLLFTGEEYFFRLGVFIANSRFVQDFNRKGTFKLSMNKFGCLTRTEYLSIIGYVARPKKPKHAISFVSTSKKTEEGVDWRTKGIVTPVKDQGKCGADWAFAAVQAQESAWAMETGQLESLSESNLIDCSYYCSGCSGGFPYEAYDYVIDCQDGTFMKLSDYPDEEEQGQCKFDETKAFSKMKEYIISWDGDENEIAEMCSSVGVLAATIDGQQTTFALYKGGIYNDVSCSRLSPNMHVGIVGYGTESSTEYWILKVSFGVNWGEKGYMRMIRGQNMCGIGELAIIPVVDVK